METIELSAAMKMTALLTQTAAQTATLTATLTAALLLTGCASNPGNLYQWGSYENQIYAMYSDGGKSPPEQQIAALEADYQKARAANKQVPPGYHAHLGYLYFQTGKADMALQSFNTEKALYPESVQYMDRLIARLTQNRKKPS